MPVARRIAELRAEYARVQAELRAAPGRVHLLGIGGVGVAGVAVQLAARGYQVSGCDGSPGGLAAWLSGRGIPVACGHHPDHLASAPDWLVRSPAVPADEPEVRAAQALGIPVFLRGTVLPALLAGRESIAVGGTHGKTTTSAMMAHVLEAAGEPVSFCIGGEVPSLGGVARARGNGVMVVEADESDGTLVLYEADHAIITNVEMDHVDFFRDESELDACFAAFVAQARRTVVVCAEDEGAQRAAEASRARVIRYGLEHGDWTVSSIRPGARGLAALVHHRGVAQGELVLGVPGRTNLLDALAVVALAVERGLTFAQAAEGLRTFRPVRRRFDVLAERHGITVISDYAHHPTEIAAFLQQVRGLQPRRILAVFQAHRYSRTAALGPAFPPAFAGVDELILAPIYAASEAPVPGGGLDDLAGHFQRHGKIPVRTVQSLLEAWPLIRKKWRAGDVIAVVGAGDVEKIAFLAAAALTEESCASSL